MSETTNRTNSALCTVEDLTAETFDYVVVGGGTADLVVAARSTENPNVKVGVLKGRARTQWYNDPKSFTSQAHPLIWNSSM